MTLPRLTSDGVHVTFAESAWPHTVVDVGTPLISPRTCAGVRNETELSAATFGKLIALGFTEIGLHRLEIKAATTNLRSQAIPEKLSFKKEGVLREAELVNDKFLDLYLYSLLSHEWTKQTTNH